MVNAGAGEGRRGAPTPAGARANGRANEAKTSRDEKNATRGGRRRRAAVGDDRPTADEPPDRRRADEGGIELIDARTCSLAHLPSWYAISVSAEPPPEMRWRSLTSERTTQSASWTERSA